MEPLHVETPFEIGKVQEEYCHESKCNFEIRINERLYYIDASSVLELYRPEFSIVLLSKKMFSNFICKQLNNLDLPLC